MLNYKHCFERCWVSARNVRVGARLFVLFRCERAPYVLEEDPGLRGLRTASSYAQIYFGRRTKLELDKMTPDHGCCAVVNHGRPRKSDLL